MLESVSARVCGKRGERERAGEKEMVLRSREEF